MDFIQFIPPELRKNAAAIVNGVKYAADAMRITDTNQINQLGKDVIKNIRAGKIMPTLSSIARYTTGMTTLYMDAMPGANLAKIPVKGAMDLATMIEKGMVKKGVKVPENADEVLTAFDKKKLKQDKIRDVKKNRLLNIYKDKTKRKERIAERANVVKDKELNELINKINLHRAKFGGTYRGMNNNPYSDEIVSAYAKIYNSKDPFKMEYLFSKVGDQSKRIRVKANSKGLLNETSEDFQTALSSQKKSLNRDLRTTQTENFLINFKKNNPTATTLEARKAVDNFLKNLSKDQRQRTYKLLENEKILEKLNYEDLNKGTSAKVISDPQIQKYLKDFELKNLPSDFDFIANILNPAQKKIVNNINKDVTSIIGANPAHRDIIRENLNRMIRYGLRDKGQTVEEVMASFEKQINNPKFLKQVVPLIAEKVKTQKYISGLNKNFGLNLDSVNLSHKTAVLKNNDLTFAIQNLFIGSAAKNTAESAIQKKINKSTDIKEIKKLEAQIKDEGLLDPISPNYPSPDTVSLDATQKIKQAASQAMTGDPLYYKKDGGVVGLNDGGAPDVTGYNATTEPEAEKTFVDKMKGLLFSDEFDDYLKVSNEPIDRGFIEDIENSTPEQRIKIYRNITLQPLEDKIKAYKEENKIDSSNENLSLDARSYLDSKDYKDEAELLYRRTVSAVQMCQPTPDMPWCKQTFPQGIPTIEELKKTYEELQNSNDFKVNTQRADGQGMYAESTDAAKKEIATMQAKRVPANIADVVFDVYQLLFPPAFVAGEAARMDEIRQGGEPFDGDDLLRFFGENNMGFLDVDEDGINDLAKLYDDLNIKFYPEGTEPREPTKKEKALSYTMTAGSLATVFMKPGYVSNIVDVLSRKDIGKFGKIISVAPRLIGVPTKAEVAMMLGVIKNAAVGTVKAPFKGAGQIANISGRLADDIQGGPQGIIVSAPGQPGAIVKNQIASKAAAQNMIKNINSILAIMGSEEQGEREKIQEEEYQANIAEEIKNPQYTAAIKTYYDNFLRQTLVNADAVLGEVEDVSLVELLATQDEYEDHPDWVVEYAKDLAKDFIKENNLKTNTIGDTLFYDMLNKNKFATGGEVVEEDIMTDVLDLGNEKIVATEEARVDIPTIPNQQESIFDDEASYEVANSIFGKVPGWAIAGVNKVDDLISTGNTGTRIAQADKIADAATTSGEKINRFYSNIEARLLDPNAPDVFETSTDLYNFLNSKGISKIEVEDYQIPQLIETMTSTGRPITKEDLLLRIKNAPIRQLETKTFGFRSEVENGDEYINGKYPDAHMEKGYIPNSYRENVLYLDSSKIPNDIQKYKYSTHGFFNNDENKYVIGWSRSSDRYAIIPGTSKQLSGATDTKLADLESKFNRLEKISVKTPEELVNQSNGRITIEQAQKNIDRAKKDLSTIKNQIDNFGDRTNFVAQPDITTKVTFADEIQSDIFQKYREILTTVKDDYQKLISKSINPQDTSRLESLRYGNNTIDINQDNIKIIQFYDKHKDIMRPMFKTADDFAAHIKELKESNKVFEDFSKIKPGNLQQTDVKLVQEAGKKRDKVLEVFEQAFTDKKTMERLFPNIPFKDRRAWGDAIIKNDINIAAKRLFVDKDANAAEWYAVSPADLVNTRYGHAGGTSTPLAERTKNMKGIGMEEFYGGPNSVDPSGKHYTGVLEEALKRAAAANNTEFKIIKVSIGDPKSMQRSFQILSPDGEIVKTNKLGRGNDASEALMKATQEAEELGEGFTVKAIEIPKGFKTVDAYAIKLTPEMILPSKTHFASGGYALYDPLVSMDEVIGAY